MFALVTLISACGGGGGSSASSSSGSSGGSSTAGTMDATGKEIVAAFMGGATSQASATSTTVGSGVSRSDGLAVAPGLDLTPIIEGGAVTGAIYTYTDFRTPGTFSGYTSLTGRVIGSGDAGVGELHSEGLFRKYVGVTEIESTRWTTDGITDVEMAGGASGGNFDGDIITTLGSGMLAMTDNDNGDVYRVDDMRVDVALSNSGFFCASGFFTLHNESTGGSQMTCTLNQDCSGCL